VKLLEVRQTNDISLADVVFGIFNHFFWTNPYNRPSWYVLVVVRVVWLLILLVSCSLFSYLIVSKITYLLSHPKNVDVSVDFKDILQFPTVTICNQNPYR